MTTEIKPKLTPQERGRLGGIKSKPVSVAKGMLYRQTYESNPKHCKQCNTIITYESRRNDFCSHTCAAKFNNKGVRRHGEERAKCIICGKILQKSYGACCRNPICILKYTINSYGDLSHQPYYRKKIIKKYYILIRGHKCEKCGTTTWLNQPVPIIAHHINGDANNWLPENVQLLCGNCHPFTSNFCGKNKGNSTRTKKYYLI